MEEFPGELVTDDEEEASVSESPETLACFFVRAMEERREGRGEEENGPHETTTKKNPLGAPGWKGGTSNGTSNGTWKEQGPARRASLTAQ